MQTQNSESKRRRILLLFLLGIGLPCLLLGYLAYRGIQNDQALLEKQTIAQHQRMAALVAKSIHDEIRTAEISYGRAISDRRRLRQLKSFHFLDTLKSRFPLVQEIFFIDDSGAVRFPAAKFLYAAHGDGAVHPETDHALPAAITEMMQEAQHYEFQQNDNQRALAAYQQALAASSNLQTKGELLNAVARVQKKLMLMPEAVESYRTLAEECRNVRMASGMPLGLIARLELGRLFFAQQDTSHAAAILLHLYQRVVDGEWMLEKSHYEFFSQKISGELHELFGVSPPPPMHAAQNTFIMLKTKEEMHKTITEKLLAFQLSAAPLLREKTARSPGGQNRRTLEVNGRNYLVSFLDVQDTNATWGLLFDENVLKTRILLAAIQLISLENVQWVVTDENGQALSKLAQPAGAQLSVRKNFAGNFPPWSLELYQKEPLFLQTLLVSGRGIYLYAFVLIGVILIVGSVVTLRSIDHELELSKMKSDFVSTVSHEFKSPLTSIRQLAEMLQSNRVPSDSRRSQYYDVIVEQSQQLSMLVDDVLNFSRMEAGRKVFSFEATDLSDLLQETVSRIQQQVDHSGFRIHADIPSRLPAVKADRPAISEALTNLLDNAIKYSGDADHLEILAFTENRHLVIAIQDFGIGIDKEEISKIFDRFYRGGDSLTRSVKGTGLGLTLVKQIATAHRGAIHVESEKGKGSTFSLRLPISDF